MDDETSVHINEAAENVIRSVADAEVSLDEMLSLACRQGKQDIVELLLESGANVNHRNKAGNTPLLEACSQGHVSIARLLLEHSADIDAPTETTYDSALTWACTLGNEEVVLLLLEKKARVEHRTKDGCTALMFAALAGHERVARLLLDHGAEINVESDSNRDSPLTFACWKGHQKVVELFLERNADIEHRTKEGFSPLMFAALGGHTPVASLLLENNAQVNVPSGSNNDIPLTSACWKGHHDVVDLLLENKSNIEHRTKDGCTPLMLAASSLHSTPSSTIGRGRGGAGGGGGGKPLGRPRIDQSLTVKNEAFDAEGVRDYGEDDEDAYSTAPQEVHVDFQVPAAFGNHGDAFDDDETDLIELGSHDWSYPGSSSRKSKTVSKNSKM